MKIVPATLAIVSIVLPNAGGAYRAHETHALMSRAEDSCMASIITCALRRMISFAILLLLSDSAFAGGSLCTISENEIWTCAAGHKRYAVCASKDLSNSAGYIQYRVMKGGNLEFVYPAKLTHPKGLFVLETHGRYASLNFRNGEYRYTIYEPLIGPASIDAEKQGKSIGAVTCSSATEGLTLNSTLDLMSQVGVSAP
jgi:hypothetical protein